MLQLREDRRNLSSTNDDPRQQPPLKGGQHLFQNADMEIDQLTTALISFTFGTKAFFDESEDLMSLDPHIIVFLDATVETESYSPATHIYVGLALRIELGLRA